MNSLSKIKKTFTLENIIFSTSQKNDNFKIIAAIDKSNGKQEKIKGSLEEFIKGKEITGYFTPIKDPRYGDQFLINSILDYTPSSKEIKNTVSALLGKVPARDLFKKEGISLETFSKVASGNYAFESLSGIGEKNLKKINEKINDQFDIIFLSSLLSGNAITKKMASKILKYNSSISSCVHMVKNEPHKLMDIPGVGFVKADNISFYADEEIPIESRLLTCADSLLEKNEENGSTFMKLSQFEHQVLELLKKENLDFSSLYENEKFIITENIIARSKTLKVELVIATLIASKMEKEIPFPKDKNFVQEFIDEYQKENKFNFTPAQAQFLELFTQKNVVCLLGYAGTGKSAIQKATVELCKSVGWTVSQAAPTGRAAQVMKGYTGNESFTLHSMFKVNQTFDNEPILPGDYQAFGDVLLVDEGSMIDIFVGEYLTAGVKKVKRLALVGDPEQLPSVGAGRFLKDLIEGGVPHVELTDVFRQSEGGILDMATKARNGKNIVPSNPSKAVKIGKDAIFHETDKDNLDKAVVHYIELLLKKVSLEDITVITPKNVGSSGTEVLNKIIQKRFNPQETHKKEISDDRKLFRVGDTILCNRNSVIKNKKTGDKSINNGELGVLQDILYKDNSFGNDKKDIYLVIDFSGVIVEWPYERRNNLSLGYAITIHKMQGSSNKVIIMIADKSSTYMLNRQLIYTGLTRPRKRLILLGDPYTINSAVRKDGSAKRNTMLATYLKQLVYKKEKLK